MTPTQLLKDQFSRRLVTLLEERGWTQADLSRRTEMSRDRISTYVRAAHLPTDDSLNRIAKAFGMSKTELLPGFKNYVVPPPGSAEFQGVEYTASERDPSVVFLKIGRRVRHTTAMKILAALAEDDSQADEAADAG